MSILYLPLFRLGVGYTVSVGRRWSVLEHLLLVELANKQRSVSELAAAANVPLRLAIEALINLLQINWIEVRVVGSTVSFAATAVGRHRAASETLPIDLKRDVRWTSLCLERLTGSWLATEDLDLVYERDLPEDAERIQPRVYTYDQNDPSIRDMLTLHPDESLEATPFNFRHPSRPYASIEIGGNGAGKGLPGYAPPKLREALAEFARQSKSIETITSSDVVTVSKGTIATEVSASDLIVGRENHLDLVKDCLDRASTNIVIHSCFLNPSTIQSLLPHFESAARRKVRVDLLWGLRQDPEDPHAKWSISESEAVLCNLGNLQSRVQLSPNSSGSHAKLIVFNDRQNAGVWTSVIGSCNFLSSKFDAIEVSLISRSQKLTKRLVSQLLFAQQPASSAWPPVARRLDKMWDSISKGVQKDAENGPHTISLVADQDHYACVTTARDQAQRRIILGCDLFGVAAETSVLVPMQRAKELGKEVDLYFQRPSVRLSEEGRAPDIEKMKERGLTAKIVAELHGKFLCWDDDTAIITSFNWLSTVVEGARNRGAELGVWIQAPGIANTLVQRLASATSGGIRFRDQL